MVTKEDLNKRKTRIDNLIHALSLLISIEYNDKNLRYKHVFVNVMGQEVYIELNFSWSYNMGRFEGQAKNWVEIYYSNFFDKSKFNIKTKKFSLEKAEDNPQLLADKILYIIDEINKSLISKNEFNNKLKSDKDLIISEFSKMDIVLKDSNIAVNNLGYDIVYSSDTERLKVVVIIKNNQILVDSINKEIRFDYSNRPVLSKETLN